MYFMSVDCILIRFRVEVWNDVTKLNDIEQIEGELRSQKFKTSIKFRTLLSYIFEGTKALFFGYPIWSIYYFGSAALGGCFVFLLTSGFFYRGIAVLNWLLYLKIYNR